MDNNTETVLKSDYDYKVNDLNNAKALIQEVFDVLNDDALEPIVKNKKAIDLLKGKTNPGHFNIPPLIVG